jgi:hypothetical protein
MSESLSLMLDPFVNGRASNFGTFGSATGFAAEADANFPPESALAYNAALKAPPARASVLETGFRRTGHRRAAP